MYRIVVYGFFFWEKNMHVECTKLLTFFEKLRVECTKLCAFFEKIVYFKYK